MHNLFINHIITMKNYNFNQCIIDLYNLYRDEKDLERKKEIEKWLDYIKDDLDKFEQTQFNLYSKIKNILTIFNS